MTVLTRKKGESLDASHEEGAEHQWGRHMTYAVAAQREGLSLENKQINIPLVKSNPEAVPLIDLRPEFTLVLHGMGKWENLVNMVLLWNTWQNQRNFHNLAGPGFTYRKSQSLKISKYVNSTKLNRRITWNTRTIIYKRLVCCKRWKT